MRQAIVVAGGLFTALLALPPSANAQFNLSPGGIFNALTRPFGTILGGIPHPPQRPHVRRGPSPRYVARPAAAPALAARADTPVQQQPAQLGWTGPLVWPSAYEDVLGYAFWPRDYDARLRAHGHGAIVATIFAPSAAFASATPVRLARNTTGSGGGETDSTAPAMCGSGAMAASAWPAQRIEQELSLTAAQREALGELRTAIESAIETVRGACRDETALPSPERLKAMVDMLWAVRDAAILVREPLKRFEASLTDEQKARFTVQSPQADPRSAQGQSESAQSRRAMMARMCGTQSPGDWPAAQIERAVRPTKAQRASLEILRKTSSHMSQMLMASCPMAMPATPLARLDAAERRLTDLIFTASAMSIALNDFYGQLSEAQKARLDTMAR